MLETPSGLKGIVVTPEPLQVEASRKCVQDPGILYLESFLALATGHSHVGGPISKPKETPLEYIPKNWYF